VVTKVYGATWSASYTSSGAKRNDGYRLYQGNDQSGSGYGDQRSLIGFDRDAIIADIGPSAQVSSITLVCNMEHWWHGAGGTLYVGMHSYTSKPNTWGSTLTWVRAWSGSFNTGQIEFDIPVDDLLPPIEDGRFQGIAIGPANSNGATYYGYMSGTGQPDDAPILTITYTPTKVGDAQLDSVSGTSASALTGPVGDATLSVSGSVDADGYAQAPTVHLGFPATTTASIEGNGGGSEQLTFNATAGAASIGALYLRQWGLPVGGS